MIKKNVLRILEELPDTVVLVAAAKARTPKEIQRAVEAGVEIIGENYVQEAQAAFAAIGHQVKWHFIGHLQKNKVKKAVQIFDMIQTVDSLQIAQEINRCCAQQNKVMPVLIEINSAGEHQKFGLAPEEAETLIKKISGLNNIRVMGFLTMGPQTGSDPVYFRQTRELFERIGRLRLPGVQMKYLSMGMSDSYRLAIAQGANMIRLGSAIFGARKTA